MPRVCLCLCFVATQVPPVQLDLWLKPVFDCFDRKGADACPHHELVSERQQQQRWSVLLLLSSPLSFLLLLLLLSSWLLLSNSICQCQCFIGTFACRCCCSWTTGIHFDLTFYHSAIVPRGQWANAPIGVFVCTITVETIQCGDNAIFADMTSLRLVALLLEGDRIPPAVQPNNDSAGAVDGSVQSVRHNVAGQCHAPAHFENILRRICKRD